MKQMTDNQILLLEIARDEEKSRNFFENLGERRVRYILMQWLLPVSLVVGFCAGYWLASL